MIAGPAGGRSHRSPAFPLSYRVQGAPAKAVHCLEKIETASVGARTICYVDFERAFTAMGRPPLELPTRDGRVTDMGRKAVFTGHPELVAARAVGLPCRVEPPRVTKRST